MQVTPRGRTARRLVLPAWLHAPLYRRLSPSTLLSEFGEAQSRSRHRRNVSSMLSEFNKQG